MRAQNILIVLCVILLAETGAMGATPWKPLTNQPPASVSTALLLTDGTVMAYHEDASRNWWKLTPDRYGNYLNGTWSKLASLPANYLPGYFASAVLKDGRVVVEGGEYNFGIPIDTNLGAIYDPVADRWDPVNPPPGWTSIGDAQSTTLADGRFMLANCCTTEAALLDANTLTWTPVGTGKADINSEEGWTLLPNGQVLTVDTRNGSNTELFDPVSGSWYSAGSTPFPLVNPNTAEVGPAILRPNGTVFATGSNGRTDIYDTATGLWSPGPSFPTINGIFLDVADGPAALLPNGNVLVGASIGTFQPDVHFFEFDGVNLTPVPATPNSATNSSYGGRMLVLPTGQIMYTDGSADVELYTAKGGPNPAWKPTISKVETVLIRTNTYKLQGTQLNGLSAGSEYGDDAQSATNYPLVRITNNGTGRVAFARTQNHSSMGVATGSLRVTTQFTVPASIDLGASTLQVVTNGIASDPVSVSIR